MITAQKEAALDMAEARHHMAALSAQLTMMWWGALEAGEIDEETGEWTGERHV
ncbi:MAG TPA: hypothetical protein PLS69_09630 [Terricaulis sp.]|nr:hypothetical protein [Terricaulis sp.]